MNGLMANKTEEEDIEKLVKKLKGKAFGRMERGCNGLNSLENHLCME